MQRYTKKLHTKRRRRLGRAGRGGPAAARYFVYLGISLYILDLFGYIFGIFQNGTFRTHNGNILSRTIQYTLIGRTHT